MKATIITLDKPNKNGRIYPREVIKRELKKYRETYVKERRAFIVNKLPPTSSVNLTDVIGVVEEIHIKNDKVIVKIKFFSDLYRQLVEEGKLSLRTSGIGTLTKQPDGTYIVGDDYELISCFVTNEPA